MNTPANGRVIQLEHVWKTYPKAVGEKANTALSDLSFSLEQGQTLGLVGANGAGKSTTIRMLMGLLRPDRGTIEVLGQSPENHLIRHKIGYLPETAAFPANLTILDMLRYCGKIGRMSPGKIKSESEKWLTVLKLWESRKRPLRNYSKGMQQRANFVLALLHDPDLLILDEPMSGLDPFGRADIFDLIQDLKKRGKTILFCSHILEDVDRLVDKVLVLDKGKNLFEGDLADLITHHQADSFVNAFKNIVEKTDETKP